MPGPVRYLISTLLLVAATSATGEARSLADAINKGEANLSLRYRIETVDQDGIAREAGASTLRTRLAFETAALGRWSGLIEFEDVSYIGNDNFNNLRNGKTQYPVVADPKGTGINQLLVRYTSELGRIDAGRQRLNLGNQRFIGGVGWRQNEQTYDGVSFEWRGNEMARASYRYIDRVQRIFGPENGSPDATLDSDSHLLEASVDAGAGKITGYGYVLDFNNAAGLSSSTWGVSYTGRLTASEIKLPFRAEVAHQVDTGANPFDYSANYYHLGVGVELDAGSVSAGFEILEADGGSAFTTPLATLHKFNGWADKFLATPAGGLEDRYLKFSLPLGNGRLGAALHQFDAETGSTDYGSEIDVSYATALSEHVDLLVKAARYDADQFATDTTKVWVMLTCSF